MTKTKIEWCDYTINPVKGLCPMACDYCYARRMYKRFKWNPEVRYDSKWWEPLATLRSGKVFVGSTCELFGDWVRWEWLKYIFQKCEAFSWLTFIFLTKCPQSLINWSPFPDNCWVGGSATNAETFKRTCLELHGIDAKVRFVSLEPLLSWDWHDDRTDGPMSPPGTVMDYMGDTLDWLIIGQQTPISAKTQPKIEWIREIVEAADKAGIPVFLKDNLDPLLRTPDGQIPKGRRFHKIPIL